MVGGLTKEVTLELRSQGGEGRQRAPGRMKRPWGRTVPGIPEESFLCLAGLLRSPQELSQTFQRERDQELTFSLLPVQYGSLNPGFLSFDTINIWDWTIPDGGAILGTVGY